MPPDTAKPRPRREGAAPDERGGYVDPSVTDDVERDLAIARGMASAGIPVLTLYADLEGKTPSGRATGYILPKGWQRTTANPAYVNAWRPGCALIAVMGCGLDLAETDPRNGGDLAALDGLLPEVLGEAKSPSGGDHAFVASMGVRSCDGILPGVDLKAGDGGGEGRGFAFIAPTVRVSKVTGEPTAYRWIRPPDLSRLGTGDPGCQLARLARQARGSRKAAGDGLFQQPAARGQLGDPVSPGGRHAALISYAGWLLSLGVPLPEAEVLILARFRDLEQPPGNAPYTEGDALAKVRDVYGRYPAGDPAAAPGPVVVSLADVEPEQIEWLWPGYLPLGKVVILDGDPGVGKSTISLDIGARLTRGLAMPDGSAGAKGAVLVLSAEDGLADTIRPRLDAAGADPAWVITITEMTYQADDGPHSRPVCIPGDLAAVERIIAAHGVRLVIVDVLMAYLSGDINAHRDQDIRRALHVLAQLAERARCCVIVLRHLNKSAGENALYRGGGSIGIIGAARAGFMCGRDPDDETGQRRVFAHTKMNIAAEPPALAYRLAEPDGSGCVRVEWLGACDRRAAELLAEPQTVSQRDEATRAESYLREALRDGPRPSKDVEEEAREARGISQRTLRRARDKLRLPTRKVGNAWHLSLPEHEGDLKDLKPETPPPAKSAKDANGDHIGADGTLGTLPAAACLHPGCPEPPRRGCSTCWPHAYLETLP